MGKLKHNRPGKSYYNNQTTKNQNQNVVIDEALARQNIKTSYSALGLQETNPISIQ